MTDSDVKSDRYICLFTQFGYAGGGLDRRKTVAGRPVIGQ